jgi:hypothetical protein
MTPTTTKESVLDALRRFDEELRHMQGWTDWANDENHKHESCYTWPPPTGTTEMDPDQQVTPVFKKTTGRKPMSAAMKKRLSAMMKARWAATKKAGAKAL